MKDNLHRWILGFAFAKFLLHLYSNNLYGLHRDEFLYIDEGKHLAWGFMEVPPFLPFLAWVGDQLGNQPWIYKLFPAIAGSLIIYIVGKLILDLGGGKWAISIASISLLCSPALLRNSSLFQPVIFNQLAWLVCGYLVIKIIREQKGKYYYLLGIVAGVGFLNKYSIVFYMAAVLIGLLLTHQRKILFSLSTLKAIAIATLIASPNIHWQWSHDWPVLAHMAELQETQLVHVEWNSFLTEQLLFHILGGLVWLAGAYALFRFIAFYRYRFSVFALVAVILIIGNLSGKAYYTFGAFYILFPFGAIALDQLLKRQWMKYLLVTLIIVAAIPTAPLGTPLIPIKNFQSYSNWYTSMTGRDDFLYWEDGQKYALPQDYADMHGWKTMVEKVAKHYHAVSDTSLAKTMIYGASCGHAGALNFYKDQFNLPEANSTSASYVWWANEKADFDQVLYIVDEYVDQPWSSFNAISLLDSTAHLYARDPGYIYLVHHPHRDPTISWKAYLKEERGQE